MDKKKKIVLMVCLGLLCAVIFVYVGVAVYCTERFNFGTTINGIEVGGKTVKEAEQIIKSQLDTYKITILERENKKEEITGKEIGISLVITDEVARMAETQSGFVWIADWMNKPAYELEQTADYDEILLKRVVSELTAMQPQNQREPVNAGYSEYTNGRYELVPADYGTVLKEKKVIKALDSAIRGLRLTVDLDEEGCYELPKIGDDHRSLNRLLDTLNHYVQTEIHYEFGSADEVLDGEIISTWLSVDNNMQVVIDRDAVLSYVKGLARKYNTAYSSKMLMTSYGEEVKITGGSYGWRIDNGGERNQIMADLETGGVIEREAVFFTKAHSFDGPDYGDSYVEINLTAQHLFLYIDGELIVESDFVSGCVANGNATPGGAFPITYTERDATLRGADYATPVSYWMPFNGNIGMHDLTSRKKFGGDVYITNGSHGCINLPFDAAKTIFEHVEKGFPVLCYFLPGSESDAVRAAKVPRVMNYINGIGPVTYLSGPPIRAARYLYDHLDEALKSQVSNYQVLLNSEAEFARIMAEGAQQAP